MATTTTCDGSDHEGEGVMSAVWTVRATRKEPKGSLVETAWAQDFCDDAGCVGEVLLDALSRGYREANSKTGWYFHAIVIDRIGP